MCSSDLSLKVKWAGEVGEAVMNRGRGLAPIYEFSRQTDDGIAYLVAFSEASPMLANGSRSVTIAEIELNAAGASLSIDPALTMIVSGDGQKATIANHGLRWSGVTIGDVPAKQPVRKQNGN